MFIMRPTIRYLFFLTFFGLLLVMLSAESGAFDNPSKCHNQLTNLKKTIACSDGCTYEVFVNGDLPGCELKVTETVEGEYLERVKDSLDEKSITYMKFLDISILKEGVEIEPDDEVEVNIRILGRKGLPWEEGTIYHFPERKIAPLLSAEQSLPGVSLKESNVSFWNSSSLLSAIRNDKHLSGKAKAALGLTERSRYPFEPSSDAVHMACFRGNSVTFKTSSFSIYGIVFSLQRTYITASGESYSIKV